MGPPAFVRAAGEGSRQTRAILGGGLAQTSGHRGGKNSRQAPGASRRPRLPDLISLPYLGSAIHRRTYVAPLAPEELSAPMRRHESPHCLAARRELSSTPGDP